MLALWAKCADAAMETRSINIQNDSGTKVEVFWIHPDTKETVLQSSPFIYNGATLNLSSFSSHAFEAREMPGKTGNCLGDDDTCRVGYFTVNSNDDQSTFYNYAKKNVQHLHYSLQTLTSLPPFQQLTAVFIDTQFNIKHQDNKSLARESAGELLADCQSDVTDKINKDGVSATDAIKELKQCVESGVATEMEKANEEIAFQSQIRRKMGELFENYTCADHVLASTEPLRETQWIAGDKIVREVHVMLDRPASRVHVIKNFISEEECQAMEDEAKPILHKATVADGKGGSELSPNRKALQAGITIPWKLESEGNFLATLSRRVYDYTNHVLKMDIDEHGQEDLMSIQYEGRGEGDETPDRYTPHCDGDCTGLGFKTGGRMATIVVYCTLPEKGGATNFRNSGLHIVPEQGSATFFSYIDPETMTMDNGFTEHSGCPVVEGEKKIVTQWVRYGVDKENPWDSFNTLGIKKSDE